MSIVTKCIGNKGDYMNRNTLEIVTIKGKLLKEVCLDAIDWPSINYVDYIAIDYHGNVIHEFKIAHGDDAYHAMQSIADQYLRN